MEGLLAFFLESTFLGLWLFGWDRLPRRVHLLTIWAVFFLWVAIWAAVLPFGMNTAGWLLTESGRQPWIVQGIMLTKNAVSPSARRRRVQGHRRVRHATIHPFG